MPHSDVHSLAPGEQIGIGDAVDRLRHEFEDVTISSLRFLEREGLVELKRTAGGHRVFDRDVLERVRLIKRLQQQHRSLAEIRELLHRADSPTAPTYYTTQFVDAISRRDGERAAAILAEAGQGGLPLRSLCFDVLEPTLVEIGARWEQGIMSIGQEHLASALIRDLLGTIRSRQRAAVNRSETIVAVCAAQERHELGLLMIVTLLEELGFPVLFLGADTPPESAVRITAETSARYLLVSVGHFADPAFLQVVLDMIDHGRTRVVAGGPGCSRLPSELTARCALLSPSGDQLLAWIIDENAQRANR